MPARNRSTGNSQRWNKEDIARRAAIGGEDVAAAKAYAKGKLPRRMKKLLEAKAVER
jgi:hypothetical protein